MQKEFIKGIAYERDQESIKATKTELELNQLCQDSFLSLWSYLHVYRDQGGCKEVCDLLVVFDNHILIFSDKENAFPDTNDLDVNWQRWFREAILESAGQIWGAERRIRRFSHQLFLDCKCKQRFPINLPDPSTMKFHRIVVAHGVSEACKEHLGGSGSLIIAPAVTDSMHTANRADGGRPFTIGWINTKKGYAHVFNDNSLRTVMQNLDTITDFVRYLTKKEQLIQSGRLALAESEEDLLAHYLQHYNSLMEHDFSVPEGHSALTVERGLWDKFVNSSDRQAQIAVDSESYAWDKLIEAFNDHILKGDCFYYVKDPSTIRTEEIIAEPVLRFLAREPRLARRELARLLLEVVKMTPPSELRYRFVHPRSLNGPCYVFVVVSHQVGEQQTALDTWVELLKAYALSAKRICPRAQHVIAIGINKNAETGIYNAQYIAYVDASDWSKKELRYVQQFIREAPILQNLRTFSELYSEYPSEIVSLPMRIPLEKTPSTMKGRDRNKPCPCGSGMKYKNCCGGW